MDFDRVAITLPAGGTESIVLESQVVVDFGHGQGPRGGVITVVDGRIQLQGTKAGSATLYAGYKEQAGQSPALLELKDAGGKAGVRVTAHAALGPEVQAAIYLSGSEDRGTRKAALVRAGGDGTDGELLLRDADGRDVLQLLGERAALYLGAKGNEGDLVVRDGQGNERIQLSAGSGKASGAKAEDENNLVVRDPSQREVLQFDSGNAALYLGADGNEGDLIVRDAEGKTRIKLSGGSGAGSGAAVEDDENLEMHDPS